MHIELKVILDLDTIVCLIRTLLYGESEIHAIQCHHVDHVDYDDDLFESDNYVDTANKVSLVDFSQF